MRSTFYGVREEVVDPQEGATNLALEVQVRGWGVARGLVSQSEAADLGEEVDRVYASQLSALGVNNLDAIQDSDVARGLALYSPSSLKLAVSEEMQTIVGSLISGPFCLYTHNGVINKPGSPHRQRLWHRDLNYQHWVSSRLLSVSVLVALDRFDTESGGTEFLTGTHKFEAAPGRWFADRYAETTTLEPGDAIVFDSMVFHRAGVNSGKSARRAINHVFTVPIIAQQVAFWTLLEGSSLVTDLNDSERGILGAGYSRPADPLEWRRQRLEALGSHDDGI